MCPVSINYTYSSHVLNILMPILGPQNSHEAYSSKFMITQSISGLDENETIHACLLVCKPCPCVSPCTQCCKQKRKVICSTHIQCTIQTYNDCSHYSHLGEKKKKNGKEIADWTIEILKPGRAQVTGFSNLRKASVL